MDAINTVINTNLWEIVISFFALAFAFQETYKVLLWFCTTFGIETKFTIKAKREHEMLLAHDKNINEIIDCLNSLKAANREILAAKINEKYKTYFRQGYIPEDEYDEFVSLHDAYNGVDGNHTGDAKYKKCITSLKVRVENEANKL